MDQPTCSVNGCAGEGRLKRGMCSQHYQAWRKLNLEETRRIEPGTRCSVDGCDAPARGRAGVCAKCYRRLWEASPKRRAYLASRIETERARGREKERRRRVADPEAVRAAHRRHREGNPEARRESERRYRESPRGRVKNRQKGARRRARMREAFVETVDFAAVLAEHGMFCHICTLVIVDESDLHFDHVVPLALGGLHEFSNIRPAHAICNLRKGAQPA